MAYMHKEFRIEKTKYSDDYESCSDCIYAEDTEAVCKARMCVHAFEILKDCYIPIREKEDEQ